MTSFEGKAVLVTGANSKRSGEAAVALHSRRRVRTRLASHGVQSALEAARKRHPKVRWLLRRRRQTGFGKLGAAVASIVDQVRASRRAGQQRRRVRVWATRRIERADDPQPVRDQCLPGLTFMTQAALPALVANKGIIVNISSAAGHKSVPGGSIYGASKAAVESLTRSWALEYSHRRACGSTRSRQVPPRRQGIRQAPYPEKKWCPR